jgi:hypothetical protein
MLQKSQRLALLLVLVVGLLFGTSAPANAHERMHGVRLLGTAFFNPAEGIPCHKPPATYDSYPPLVIRGSLHGCWYTHIKTKSTTRDGKYLRYLEKGTELFEGRLNGGHNGTFTTTYVFKAKLNLDQSEVSGHCEHPIVAGSGTGGFVGAKGQVNFKDIIGEEITYVYRGHIRLR